MSALLHVDDAVSEAQASPGPVSTPLESTARVPVTSSELGDLFGALSQAQDSLTDPAATGMNEDLGTRHLTLAGVLAAARPVLKENGLCIIQMPAGDYLRTILGHKSGQFIQCDTPLLQGRADLVPMQALASAVSFARRIAATSMLGVAQPDDDGQSTGVPSVTGRPALGLVSASSGADGAPVSTARRGFSVTATIDAIKGKSTASELDDAKLRVEAAFSGEDLQAALAAIEERRKALSLTAS